MAKQTINQSQAQGTTLGYAQIITNFSTTTVNSYVDITGLSVTVTVPTGSRRIKITGFALDIKSTQTVGNGTWLNIVEDSTIIAESVFNAGAAGYANVGNVISSKVPSAGVHTYKLQCKQTATGTYTVEATTTAPAFILVELI